MTNKLTNKDIEKLIKDHFKKVNIHLRLLKTLHELSLLKREFARAEFEAIVKEHVGESDFEYLKTFHKINK